MYREKKYRIIMTVITVAGYFVAGSASGTTVMWVADDLADGVVTSWTSQGDLSIPASMSTPEGRRPTKNSQGVFFDGDDALEIAAGDNFLVGATKWTATVVFKANAANGEGGATKSSLPSPNNPDQWWGNAGLVGCVFSGVNVGDWGLFLNSEHEVVFGTGGNPSTGRIHDGFALNDNKWHVLTATFDADKKNRTIYLDGQALYGQQGVSICSPEDHILFGCNQLSDNDRSLGQNNRAFFKGTLSTVILEDNALNRNEVLDLQASLGINPKDIRVRTAVNLFNGRNFVGWGMSIDNNYDNVIGDDIWSITNQGEAFAQAANKPRTGLYTLIQDYGNYELTFEYMYTQQVTQGDSGVWILGGPDFIDSKYAFPASIEMQLRTGHEGDLLRKQLYLEAEPGFPVASDEGHEGHRIIRRADPHGHIIGVWHSARIVTEVTPEQGSTISFWINGVFVNKGIRCERNNGCIVFQGDGYDIKFRDIVIQEKSDINISVRAIDFDEESDPNNDDVIRRYVSSNRVGNIKNNSWIKFSNFDFEGGVSSLDLFASSGGLGGTIEARIDGADGALLGSKVIPNTGGWNTFNKYPVNNISSVTGEHDLYFVFKDSASSGGDLLTFRNFQFNSK